MQWLKRLAAPFPLTRWNVTTLACAMGIVVAGAHFLLGPVAGLPEPSGFFLAAAVLLPVWSFWVRRDDQT